MKLIPAYMVSYKGSFYQAGEEFRIDPDDKNDMQKHGKIIETGSLNVEEKEQTPRRGRPRWT